MKNNSDYDMESHKDLIDSLYSHAHQELGFKKPPMLIFQSDPRNYGALAKTAQYNPSSQEITIYVDGRHIKDILRSFAHELVHHHQNEQGRLSGANVTQGEQDFDDIEGEAYHTGNLKLFRKWEDGIKENSPTIYNERRIYKMSTKKWKNKELSKLMTEKHGFKMDLSKLNESVQEEALEEAADKLDEMGCTKEEVAEGACGKAHEGLDESDVDYEATGHLKPGEVSQRGYINDKGEWLPLGTPEAKEFEQEMLQRIQKFRKPTKGFDKEPDFDAMLNDPNIQKMVPEAVDPEDMQEGKDEKCEKCEKAKSDCECPKKEELGNNKIDPTDDVDAGLKGADGSKVSRGDVAAEKGGARGPGKKKNKKLKEHKVWNDRGFKMDLNKLLK